MCKYCESIGEGRIWYKNPKNYARHMYKLKKPGEKPKGAWEDPEGQGMEWVVKTVTAKANHPERFPELQKGADEWLGTYMPGQVIPLQDALEMVEIAAPIATIPCMCRKLNRGIEEKIGEHTCIGLGVGMFKWERWPERYRGGVDFISPDEAKKFLVKLNKRGFVHSVMVFGLPFIGGLCNCDYPSCLGFRTRLDYGINHLFLKSHYYAKINYERCNGCGVCAQRCLFGALKYEVSIEKTNIDMSLCFGCGLCETACPRGAISLLERASSPILKDEW